MRGEVGDRTDAQGFRAPAGHHQRIGILKPEFAEQGDVLPRQRGFQFAKQFGARLDLRLAELIGPERPGIIDITIDVVAHQRPERDGGAEAVLVPHREARALEALADELRQDELLAEILGADEVSLSRAREQREQRGGSSQRQAGQS